MLYMLQKNVPKKAKRRDQGHGGHEGHEGHEGQYKYEQTQCKHYEGMVRTGCGRGSESNVCPSGERHSDELL